MEHYLGEKLKKLRESRGWTQADLAKRLNKAVSTISGYESDAHAIPLDVLASISSLFSISTDELLGLDACPGCLGKYGRMRQKYYLFLD